MDALAKVGTTFAYCFWENPDGLLPARPTEMAAELAVKSRKCAQFGHNCRWQPNSELLSPSRNVAR